MSWVRHIHGLARAVHALRWKVRGILLHIRSRMVGQEGYLCVSLCIDWLDPRVRSVLHDRLET